MRLGLLSPVAGRQGSDLEPHSLYEWVEWYAALSLVVALLVTIYGGMIWIALARP